MDVLVLNANYQPVGIATWQDVMTKLYSSNASERMEVVIAYQDRFIRSAHAQHPMPSVVRYTKQQIQKKKNLKFSRDHVWARDKGRCQYCGQQVPRDDYTYDHVIPKSRGGKTDWFNIVAACKICNARKGSQTLKEAGMVLKVKPVRPEFLPVEFKPRLRWRSSMPNEWKAWMEGEYWHGGD